MFERPDGGERAILVHITLRHQFEQPELPEFIELVRAAGIDPVAIARGTRKQPDKHSFAGSGKVEEIAAAVIDQAADVVLFNHELTPSQERNLEQMLKCRVLDRTGVILDIFAQRARSFEGKLQVELAQLEHLSTRLVRGWTHLERQKGGIGLRGPGETQLETDRRLLGDRIKHIHRRLDKVSQQRELSRRARQQNEIPVVLLVGYTNAGKSTLFNQLTQAEVYAADQLFATLDATLRRICLPDKKLLILADTVGFVQHLPHNLIAAFRATLDETRLASLLLHVVDASDPERRWRIDQVNQVLADIGADTVPQILVYNKIDCLPAQMPRAEYDDTGRIAQVWLSAAQGQGMELLRTALQDHLNPDMVHRWIRVPVQAGHLRARFYQLGQVLCEQHADNGDSLLEVQMQQRSFQRLLDTHAALLVDNGEAGSIQQVS